LLKDTTESLKWVENTPERNPTIASQTRLSLHHSRPCLVENI